MRAAIPSADLTLVARQIEAALGTGRIRGLNEGFAQATPDLVAAVLDGAEAFARETLVPLNDAMDAHGCILAENRVRTAPGHLAAWKSYVDAGWPTLGAPLEHGGQGLPAVLAFAAQELFDRACPAFGMLPVPQRSALRLIAAHGDADTIGTWLEPLASGTWGATICVSEADAGSDLARLRTRASPGPDGGWSITGEKCWISFGDHDLTGQIGHAVLAKVAGDARPSLFLVPALLANGARNAVLVRRIEHKLGLHGSPTCALGFEGAYGVMLGERGRGLPQMFVMIANMRLAVGAMGLGIASGCADLAMAYAHDRRQGGQPDPRPIAEHPDVQRRVVEMAARSDLLRGLLFAAANASDLAAHGDAEAAVMARWLLPIVKTLGGEVAFDNASDAIQVLGGAGYTREWPAEQALRDSRVLTIFEGTTGMQAQDLVHRGVLAGDGAEVPFLAAARLIGEPRLNHCVDRLETAMAWIRANPDGAYAGATAFLGLAASTALSWIAAGYVSLQGDDPATARLRAIADAWLNTADAQAARRLGEVLEGEPTVAAFRAVAGNR